MRIASYRHAGLAVTDHRVEVPLDHSRPPGPTISVFARELATVDKAGSDLPWLLWLNGGPGGKAPRPAPQPAWLRRALQDHRVLLLDQRGTGRSTPLNRQTLPRLGDATAQAEHLTRFRADAIVEDAEILRRELLGPGGRWTVLGQSYGGFCALTYLSSHPEGLASVLVAGGLPPLAGSADDVYRTTYDRVAEKNAAFFETFPESRQRVTAVVEHLRHHDVRMPTGERLTPARFLAVGLRLGTRSGFDPLHYLLDEAFVEDEQRTLTDTFLAEVGAIVSYASNPLYAVLHESIYCQGSASRWAAHRVRSERPDFDVDADEPLLTGEMMYPFHVEEDPALAPLADAAHLLAERDDWPSLYDVDALGRNEVPVAAAIYHDDMFVAREHSLATAAAVRGLRPWVTNQYEHDGIRESPDVLDRLLAMAGGQV